MTMIGAMDLTAKSDSSSDSPTTASSRGARIGSWILGSIASVFLLFDGVFKLVASPESMKGTEELGYTLDVVRPLGWLELVLLVLYWVPRTRIFGALLWTGYLGGAIATHVRVGNPWATHILFPVYVALLIWGAVWLRDARVRELLPWRR